MPATGPERLVVVFGAGATKACGGPLTREILPDALAMRDRIEKDDYLAVIEAFLREHFYLPLAPSSEDYPDLPLLLSLIDTARARGESFGSNWDRERLDQLREGLEYATFAVIEQQLKRVPYRNPYRVLLDTLCERASASLTIVSLNYDIIVDNVLSEILDEKTHGALPDYACDIATPAYQAAYELPRADRDPLRLVLLKLHGSLNWMYCPNCNRLDLGVAESGHTVKVLGQLWATQPSLRLEERYTSRGRPCPDCETRMRALLITPTSQKDYGNPHIARIWYTAARALRRADRVVFIGYSLPHDDIEVAYLLKRGLAHLPSSQITVVEHSDPPMPLGDHDSGRRYRTLFGVDIEWWPKGFESWTSSIDQAGL